MKSSYATAVLLCLFSFADSAVAGGFADVFRDFVLGPEAQARPAGWRDSVLDQVAADCMRCHNGSAGSHVRLRAAGTPVPTRGSQTLNHPTGMLYDRSVLKDPQGYRPSASLPPDVRLVDGKVTCVSCHRLKTDTPEGMAGTHLPAPGKELPCTASRELTMGPRDKELCLSCHIK